LYFLAKFPGYLGNNDLPLMDQMLSSLGFFEWTAVVHLALLAGSTHESQWSKSFETDGMVIPGLNNKNETTLDQVLKADRELFFPIYGFLVLLLKSCVASGRCVATGSFTFLVDQYFPLENVLIPALKTVRQTLNDGDDVKYEESLVKPVSGFIDTTSLIPLGNMLLFSSGFAQLIAVMQGNQAPGYQKISKLRASIVFSYFFWVGINNVQIIFEQAVRLGNYTHSVLNNRFSLAEQKEADPIENKKEL
jgi:hypothetical protein